MFKHIYIEYLICLLFFSIVGHLKCYSQFTSFNEHDFVALTATVQQIDSQYILTVKLSVTNGETIEIDGDFYYDEGGCNRLSPGMLFLKKKIRTTTVNISTNSLRNHVYSENVGKLIRLQKNTLHIDTINLNNYYPFEIGSYTLDVGVEYYYKKKKYIALAQGVEFRVSCLPRNPVF